MIPQSQIPALELMELRGLCASTPQGLIVEVGVYKGGSAWALSQVAYGRPLHLFDTFTGIPFQETERGDIMEVGRFNDTSAEAVQAAVPEAILHIGIFPETLPSDFTGIAFIHVDCDQHKSTYDVIQCLWPHVVPGGIMAFDDSKFDCVRTAINRSADILPPGVHKTPSGMLYFIKDKP